MNKPTMLLTLLVSAAGAAGQNLVHNGGFEIPNASNPSLPEGWGAFNTARYRTIGDNMGPILVRTGSSSIELASGSDFVGFTTNVFNPATLRYFDPVYVYQGGPATVSGYYAIPADQPLTGANAGIKLEFRRDNSSIYEAFESLTINGHTNGQWVYFSMTILNGQINPNFPPFPTSVSILPMRFGASSSTGTIFWDDISFVQGASCYANCDGSTTPPILNVLDFVCFQSLYAQGSSLANCDNSTTPPTLNVLDFICFQTSYAQGCP
jgi:hypothetical protein